MIFKYSLAIDINGKVNSVSQAKESDKEHFRTETKLFKCKVIFMQLKSSLKIYLIVLI